MCSRRLLELHFCQIVAISRRLLAVLCLQFCYTGASECTVTFCPLFLQAGWLISLVKSHVMGWIMHRFYIICLKWKELLYFKGFTRHQQQITAHYYTQKQSAVHPVFLLPLRATKQHKHIKSINKCSSPAGSWWLTVRLGDTMTSSHLAPLKQIFPHTLSIPWEKFSFSLSRSAVSSQSAAEHLGSFKDTSAGSTPSVTAAGSGEFSMAPTKHCQLTRAMALFIQLLRNSVLPETRLLSDSWSSPVC